MSPTFTKWMLTINTSHLLETECVEPCIIYNTKKLSSLKLKQNYL